jgi:hydrogenase expression/formation protein HypE
MQNKSETISSDGISCQLPINKYDKILLAHGSGGTLSNRLIKDVIMSEFKNEILDVQHDGAMFTIGNSKLAYTTDSYVVSPLFFPGGDIGTLAVYGTVNDLSMCGAKPLYISVGFIMEEGFEIEQLKKIISSMKLAADLAGVQIVTGDTKVVEHGKCDKIFINTSGIGIIDEEANISPQNCKPGDVIIINGRIAEHGIAIISCREGFEFEKPIQSDLAPLNSLVESILKTCKHIHVMRDPTRGGLASSLNEIADASNVGIVIEENAIPISEEVKGACELLGFDPLYVANEGKVLVFVPAEFADVVLNSMRNHQYGKDSMIIGRVVDEHPGTVVLKTSIGSSRIVDMLSGEQLPRIC